MYFLICINFLNYKCREVLPCSVVIRVQPGNPVKFLAVILVLLQSSVQSGVVEDSSERIVMYYLLDRSVFICYSTVVAKMVLGVVVEYRQIVFLLVEGAVSSGEQDLVDLPVLV